MSIIVGNLFIFSLALLTLELHVVVKFEFDVTEVLVFIYYIVNDVWSILYKNTKKYK